MAKRYDARVVVVADAELLAAWAEGDQRAARELFDRFFSPLFRFFHGKVGQRADDLVQETFMATVKARDAFRGEGSFRGFLFGIARNVLKQHYRKKRRKDDPIDFGTMSIEDLTPGPVTLLAKRAEQRLVLEALRALPLDRQIALELYLWEGLTAAELAGLFEISEAAAQSRVRRAREDVKRHVEQLAESPELLASTLSDLDDWARKLRDGIETAGSPSS